MRRTLCIAFLLPSIALCAPVGLSNKGNTCYMNATLQALLNIPELIAITQNEYVNNASYSAYTFERIADAVAQARQQNKSSYDGQALTDFYAHVDLAFESPELANMFNEMNEAITQAQTVLAAATKVSKILERRIDSASKRLDRTSTEAAKKSLEAYITQLVEIQSDLNEGATITELQSKLGSQREFLKKLSYRQQDAQEFFTLFIDSLASVAPGEIGNIFGINIAQLLGGVPSQGEFTYLLSLPLSPGIGKAYYQSIQDAADGFCSAEIVEYGGRTDVEKRQSFARVPTILVTHLKRFETTIMGTLQRVNAAIVPTSPLIFTKKTHGIDARYELESIVVQSGSLSGGHYVAYIKSYQDGLWYFCNDSSVEKLGKDLIPNASYPYDKNAYLVFYRRTDNPAVAALTELSESLQSLAQAFAVA